MGKVRIIGARLSSNPTTKVSDHEQGLNGQINETVNNKLFYVVDAMVLKGLTPVVKSQMVWADDNGRFAISAADYNEFNAGLTVDGKLVRFEGLTPYDVDGVMYDHAELLVLDGQSESDVINAFVKRNRQQAESLTKGNAALDTKLQSSITTEEEGK